MSGKTPKYWMKKTLEERRELRARKARKRLDREERRRKVCEMRLQGLTFEAISRAMGYKCKTSAYRVYEEAMRDVARLPKDTLRKQYDLRTERAIRQLYAILTSPKSTVRDQLQAAQQLVDAEGSRAKVLGYAEPTQHRVGGASGAPPITVTPVDYGDLAGLSDADLAEARQVLAAAAQAERRPAATAVGGPGDGAPPSPTDVGG